MPANNTYLDVVQGRPGRHEYERKQQDHLDQVAMWAVANMSIGSCLQGHLVQTTQAIHEGSTSPAGVVCQPMHLVFEAQPLSWY